MLKFIQSISIYQKIYLYSILLSLFFFNPYKTNAQCFATPGNPVGGTSNMGTMQKNHLRISSAYQYSYSNQYYEGYKRYKGSKAILSDANYNFTQLMFAYGIIPKLTVESELGYFINKTQTYSFSSESLRGSGFSNATFSAKTKLYDNIISRFSISMGLGVNIPCSQTMQIVNGTQLPIDIQPSTGSYGGLWQTYIVKENSFKGSRYFYTNRIESFLPNKTNFTFGTSINQSIYYSKHFDKHNWKLNDWTLIIQLRNQIKTKNKRDDVEILASGGCSFWIVPQVNLFLKEKWNISTFFSVPIYQNLNDVQLGNSFSFGLNIIRDINLGNE
jgi:hypothetical protein